MRKSLTSALEGVGLATLSLALIGCVTSSPRRQATAEPTATAGETKPVSELRAEAPAAAPAPAAGPVVAESADQAGETPSPEVEGPVQFRIDDRQMPEAPADVITGFSVPAIVSEPLAYYVTSPEHLARGERLEAREAPGPTRPAPRQMGVAASEDLDGEKPSAAGGEQLQAEIGGGSPVSFAPPFSSTFDSITFTDNPANTGGFLFIPPDPIGAAGPDHVVSVVNVTIQFHTKAGAPLLGATGTSLSAFFTGLGCPPAAGNFTFDPKVIYDQYAGRFLVLTLEREEVAFGDPMDDSRILLAVSDDADPTGVWNCTAIPSKLLIGATSTWADYPGFAVDEEAVYITANMFGFGGGAFVSSRLWVVDKFAGAGGGFYTPGGTATVSLFDPTPGTNTFFTLQPAHIFGTAPTTPNVGTWFTAYNNLTFGGPGAAEALQLVRLDDPIGPGTPTFAPSFAVLADIEDVGGGFGFPPLPDAPQAGSTETIETNDSRTLNAVWRNGRLYTVTTINPKAGDPSSGEATAHWIEIDTSTLGSPVASDQGSIDGDDIAAGTHTFFPSIAVNAADELAIGFSASASTIFGTSAYTTRAAADPAGTTTGSTVLRAGLDFYIRTFDSPPCDPSPARNRWGDYSGAAIDPANDQCFWIYNEHAIARGSGSTGGCNGRPATEDGRWGTAFGNACTCSETFALTTGNWKQISLPCNPGIADTVAEVFGDDLGGTYGTNWVVFRRDAATESNVQLATTDTLAVGEGYWIKTNLAAQSVAVEGADNVATDTPLVGVAAAPPAGCASSAGRCNKVGHPHNFNVCWADVLVDDGGVIKNLATVDPGGSCQTTGAGCIMSRVAYKWTGAAYAAFDGTTPGMEGTLVPWDGVWVSANKPGIELRIPATPGGPGLPCGPPAFAAPEGWFIRLIAESEGLRDSFNVFGQLADSRQGYDAHDLQELPPFGDSYLTVVFPHHSWGDQAGDYASDYHRLRPGRDRWRFEVRSSNPGATVTLRWEGPGEKLRSSILVDEETGRRIRVRPGGRYRFTMTDTVRSFRWKLKAHD